MKKFVQFLSLIMALVMAFAIGSYAADEADVTEPTTAVQEETTILPEEETTTQPEITEPTAPTEPEVTEPESNGNQNGNGSFWYDFFAPFF